MDFLNFTCKANSPIVVVLQHGNSADMVFDAIRHPDSTDDYGQEDCNLLNFIIDRQLWYSSENDEVTGPLAWDGRRDDGKTYSFEIVPTGIMHLDVTGKHLLVFGVTASTIEIPQPILIKKPDGGYTAQRNPVVAPTATPVTVYINTTGDGMLLSYGPEGNDVRLAIDKTLLPSTVGDFIPTRCRPAVKIDELDIQWIDDPNPAAAIHRPIV